MRVTGVVHHCSAIAMICYQRVELFATTCFSVLNCTYTYSTSARCHYHQFSRSIQSASAPIQLAILALTLLVWEATSTIVNVSSCNCFWYVEKTVRMSVRKAIIFKLSKSARKRRNRSCFFVRRCEVCHKTVIAMILELHAVNKLFVNSVRLTSNVVGRLTSS